MTAKLRLLLLALVAALSGYAAWYREPPPPSLAGTGVVLAFDITQSMQVEDVRVDGRATSRLDLARRAALRSLASLPCGVSVGVAVFAAHRTVLLYSPVELCANRAEILHSIALVDTNMAWGGNSEVAKGYHASLAIARALPMRPALVFLTDGHEAPPVNPRYRPSFQGEAGEIRAAVVGVGGGLPVPIPKRDPTGRAIGYWNADEVMQVDPYRTPRTAGSSDLLVESGTATDDDLRAAGTPGSEHLSSLRSNYLQLLAGETGAVYRTLHDQSGLAGVVNELLSIPLSAAPIPARLLAVMLALAAAAAFYGLGFLPRYWRGRPARAARWSPSRGRRRESSPSVAPDRTAAAGHTAATRDFRTSH